VYCIPTPHSPPDSLKEESHEILLEILMNFKSVLSAWEQWLFKISDSKKAHPVLHLSIKFLNRK
jgi:hypothetical protein